MTDDAPQQPPGEGRAGREGSHEDGAEQPAGPSGHKAEQPDEADAAGAADEPGKTGNAEAADEADATDVAGPEGPGPEAAGPEAPRSDAAGATGVAPLSASAVNRDSGIADSNGNGDSSADSPNSPSGNGSSSDKPKGRQKRPKRTGWRRALPTWRMVLGGVLLLALLLVGGFIAGYKMVDIPAANAAAEAESNVYLYEDGSVIARDGEINREKVRLSQVPAHVRHAVLAAEDRDYYSESAVDVKAMLRAGWKTLTGKGKQGGSTITQQYVKNYYLGQEQTLARKSKEFFIAIKLDREESKDDILEGYLNTSYFGRNAYGIQAASQAYYGKDVGKLTTAEGAYLASLLSSPSANDVVANPGNKPEAVSRWNYVVDGMVKKGWLKERERTAMTFPQPGKVKPATALSGQRGYLVQAIRDYLTQYGGIDEKTLATGGHRITTTLDKKKQNALVKAVDDNVMSKTDEDRKADRNVRVGGASIDPRTGAVVAMYGGKDYTQQYVNNATRRDYQVGSTFKPFVLTSAIDNGSSRGGHRITPNTVYDGTNKRMVQGPGGPTGYSPENEDNRSYGPITIRTATDKSVNAVYAQLAQDVGPGKVKQTAIDLGIPKNTPDLTASPSIALGPATASVLDMTQAYATLANHGKHGTYKLVEKVTKNDENVPLAARAGAKQTVSRQSADTTTSVLRSVVDGGTGTAARAAGRPAAGKTGTAEEDKAAWFAGYTPDLATVIAVMGQDPDTGVQKPLYNALGLPRINGGGAPAETWAQYTEAALRGTAVQNFHLDLEPGADESSAPTDEASTPGDTDTPPASRNPSDTPSRDPDSSTPPGTPTTGGTTTPPGDADGGTGTDGGDDGGADTGGDTDGGTSTGGDDGNNGNGNGGGDGGGSEGGFTGGAGPF
ncbi:transglycosylase domain-containing protein [Streptomyces sp. AM 4-1-1]|uniref:transglycosylase domain-containing protein n=1 Tax=Streptomyces sp. AM 4-1-1 TaxID=3028710 RepID=UPI0023B9382F|nr:transglycosylase domain-containing protein [Streptomyces sp. AM 4-1-1]WEH33641.1 transglycosylase domain-containing protein [Streptomyces sp. AM 4-1-1]